MKKYYIGIDIGGTNLRIGVIDENYQVIEFAKLPTITLSNAVDKVAYLSEVITPYINKYQKENIVAVSMALASLMDKERTYIYSSPMIKGFDNIPLKQELEAKLGVNVYLEKDVNILLLYEIYKNNLPKEGIIAGTFIGTGLGNAMCINGQVYAGSSGTACELGHMAVPHLEEMCGCGKKGCIELLACGKLFTHLAKEVFQCDVQDIFKLHAKSPEVQEIINNCAIAIANEITILDPIYMILGGGVVMAEGFPIEDLKSAIRNNLRYPNPRNSIKFLSASNDQEAGVVGAAVYAANKR